ncbi:MAG TPA: hypothetical protein VJ772_01840 [Nitrososphaeraceae archaeon]|nr:hypothetical protein [Nitrososphaeraceae archaeon]
MLNRNQIRKIEDIDIPTDQIQKVNEYRQLHKDGWIGTTEFTHFLRRETTIEGLCCLCMSLPTKLVTYRSGFQERYCDKHLDRIKDNLEYSEHLIIKYK